MNNYRVWRLDEEEEGDAKEFVVLDPGDAAEMWAEDNDLSSAEYDIGDGGEVAVCVRDLSTGELTHWKVRGEFAPYYTAHPVQPPAPGGVRVEYLYANGERWSDPLDPKVYRVTIDRKAVDRIAREVFGAWPGCFPSEVAAAGVVCEVFCRAGIILTRERTETSG